MTNTIPGVQDNGASYITDNSNEIAREWPTLNEAQRDTVRAALASEHTRISGEVTTEVNAAVTAAQTAVTTAQSNITTLETAVSNAENQIESTEATHKQTMDGLWLTFDTATGDLRDARNALEAAEADLKGAQAATSAEAINREVTKRLDAALAALV